MNTLRIFAAVSVCLILASCRGESAQPADQMVKIGTHSLQMHREGKGAPAIVIDAGITDGIDKLRPLSFILGQDYKDLGAMAEGMTAQWQAVADSAAKSADPGEKARGRRSSCWSSSATCRRGAEIA